MDSADRIRERNVIKCIFSYENVLLNVFDPKYAAFFEKLNEKISMKFQK